LDLFSGLGGFSTAFEDAPDWDVVTVDINEQFDPDIQANVLDLMPSDLHNTLGDTDVLVILAGHPCTLFSLAGNHDAWGSESQEMLTPEARDAVASVYHTLGLIKGLSPDYWFLENPRGRLRWFLGEPTGTVTYCQYGGDWQKPTDLWGEHPPGLIYRSCSPGDPCHERTSQGDDNSGGLVNSIRDPAKRAKVPQGLSKEILESVECRHKQTTLVRADGGRNYRAVDTDTDWDDDLVTDGGHGDDMEHLFEWVNDEIKRKSEEIEKLEHAGHDRQKVRLHGRKVGFNQGLRYVREEIADRLDGTGIDQSEGGEGSVE